MGPLNRNAAFRRQGMMGSGPSSCRLKAAFRGGFMERVGVKGNGAFESSIALVPANDSSARVFFCPTFTGSTRDLFDRFSSPTPQ